MEHARVAKLSTSHVWHMKLKSCLPISNNIKARAVQTRKKKMSWSDSYNYYLLQRGNRYYEDSEDSQSSQETDSSQSSQETDSSQEVREHLNPWSRILDEAQERHEVQLDALVDEYKRNGDSENVAHLKVQNALLPLYRKELRCER